MQLQVPSGAHMLHRTKWRRFFSHLSLQTLSIIISSHGCRGKPSQIYFFSSFFNWAPDNPGLIYSRLCLSKTTALRVPNAVAKTQTKKQNWFQNRIHSPYEPRQHKTRWLHMHFSFTTILRHRHWYFIWAIPAHVTVIKQSSSTTAYQTIKTWTGTGYSQNHFRSEKKPHFILHVKFQTSKNHIHSSFWVDTSL